MLFTTVQFALFFLIVFALNWLLKKHSRPYKGFLLAANAVFYGSLDIRFLPLLLAVGFTNWAAGHLIDRAKNEKVARGVVYVDVALNLSLLAFFKYFEFFYTLTESILLKVGLNVNLPLAEIIFPIGISFFTFQGLSYTIDVYRDPKQMEPSLVDILLFVSFFPTVLSGPIMRAKNFLPQLKSRVYDNRAFQAGFALILSGLFKKIVIASYLSENIVRQVFQVPANYSSLTVLAAVYSYSIQIFCDFSGYSDLAIGLALLLGYSIPENFRHPYRALNLQEFWHRWHISLSTWLRDYLYISLGGNRHGSFRKYLNLMITMVLGGLWHGAHMRFILWGALHGLGLMVTHIWRDMKGEHPPEYAEQVTGGQSRFKLIYRQAFTFWNWFLTFNFVSFLWVFFRAEDASRALEIFQAVFTWNQPGQGFEFMVIPAILTGLALNFIGPAVYRSYLWVQERLPVPLQAVSIAVLCVVILRMGPEGVLPFIYFQF